MKQKTLWIFTSEAKSIFPLIALINKIGFFLFALIKLIYNDKQLVGKEIGISIVYALGCPLIFTSLIVYFFIVIKFLKSTTESMSSEIKEKVTKRFDLLATLVYFILPLTTVSTFLPLFGIGFHEYRNIFAKVMLIGMYTCVHIHMCIHCDICICIDVCIYIHICIYVYIYMYWLINYAPVLKGDVLWVKTGVFLNALFVKN
jgi:hypothetical protein